MPRTILQQRRQLRAWIRWQTSLTDTVLDSVVTIRMPLYKSAAKKTVDGVAPLLRCQTSLRDTDASIRECSKEDSIGSCSITALPNLPDRYKCSEEDSWGMVPLLRCRTSLTDTVLDSVVTIRIPIYKSAAKKTVEGVAPLLRCQTSLTDTVLESVVTIRMPLYKSAAKKTVEGVAPLLRCQTSLTDTVLDSVVTIRMPLYKSAVNKTVEGVAPLLRCQTSLTDTVLESVVTIKMPLYESGVAPLLRCQTSLTDTVLESVVTIRIPLYTRVQQRRQLGHGSVAALPNFPDRYSA
ncbi:hypothetical protein J6590_098322 [Homalodisca vitripennis]|nr:hypothetical protein J6590_098322 [Homalodisca vitripennis]